MIDDSSDGWNPSNQEMKQLEWTSGAKLPILVVSAYSGKTHEFILVKLSCQNKLCKLETSRHKSFFLFFFLWRSKEGATVAVKVDKCEK